jgi:hypothetical protein
MRMSSMGIRRRLLVYLLFFDFLFLIFYFPFSIFHFSFCSLRLKSTICYFDVQIDVYCDVQIGDTIKMLTSKNEAANRNLTMTNENL